MACPKRQLYLALLLQVLGLSGSHSKSIAPAKYQPLCEFDGVTYESGSKIPMTDPCRFCICELGAITCYLQACPPPPDKCTELRYDGLCNPVLYHCPIPKEFGRSNDSSSDSVADCVILGVPYSRGMVVGVATSSCLECRCVSETTLFCRPVCCMNPVTPYDPPMLLGPGPVTTRSAHPLDHLRGQPGAPVYRRNS